MWGSSGSTWAWDPFLEAGLHLGTVRGQAEVPALAATLWPDELVVRLGPDFSWSYHQPTSSDIAAMASFGRLLVGVTTAVQPRVGLSMMRLSDKMADDEVALGTVRPRFQPETQHPQDSDFDHDKRLETFALLSEMIRRELGVEVGDNVLAAAIACCHGDSHAIAALHGRDRNLALLLVAALHAMGARSARTGKVPPGEGVHVLLPDEPAARNTFELFKPVLTALDKKGVALLPRDNGDVLVGTPERFAGARSTGKVPHGRLAILVGVGRDALPSDFLDLYRRVVLV
ncbi:hypothetical protein GCM10029964_077300 [Kibdelosporangium lantanae]